MANTGLDLLMLIQYTSDVDAQIITVISVLCSYLGAENVIHRFNLYFINNA